VDLLELPQNQLSNGSVFDELPKDSRGIAAAGLSIPAPGKPIRLWREAAEG
jgi:hypothetical protein